MFEANDGIIKSVLRGNQGVSDKNNMVPSYENK